jgi:hypothetical protein
LIRDCYGELDRAHTDPACPIRTWRDAFVPAPAVGVFEHADASVDVWLARFHTNELMPGSPDAPDVGLADLVRRGAALAADTLRSTRGDVPGRAVTGADLLLTVLRGLAVDGLLREPGGFGRVDGEDFRAWLLRHGANPSTLDGGLVRGMYDLVFGYREGDRARPEFSAGLGVFLAIRMFLDYKGALFWKMTAGMGDVVFAPLHEALVRRGVDIRYFHRVDALRPADERASLDAIRVVRQVPAETARSYEPLQRVGGIPCFPERPMLESSGAEISRVPTESRPYDFDGEALTLRRGEDFDAAVLAVSLGGIPDIAKEVVLRDQRWQAMIEHVGTVRTRSVQVWFRPDESGLGWRHPGATLAGLRAEFDTCASMSHLLEVEDWPSTDAPQALAYLCSATRDDDEAITAQADAFLREWSSTLWPGVESITLDADAVRAHYELASTDGSDRYVQALPGSDAYRLRVDESGLDNLVLAGDWTNCGLNAGCIEAAVISGVQAAAAIEGRPLCDRVIGPLTWDWE